MEIIINKLKNEVFELKKKLMAYVANPNQAKLTMEELEIDQESKTTGDAPLPAIKEEVK